MDLSKGGHTRNILLPPGKKKISLTEMRTVIEVVHLLSVKLVPIVIG